MKTWSQNLKHLTAKEYELIRRMCHLSKDIYNMSLYNIRQQYESEGTYLRYEANYPLMKDTPQYKLLGANVAQQSMKFADYSFKSFFGLKKLAKSGKYESWKIEIPKYLPKDGYYMISFAQTRIKDGKFVVPMSFAMRSEYDEKVSIPVPKHLQDKHIRQIRIIPRYRGRYFEIRYMFDEPEDTSKPVLNFNKALGIDLGINNLATCASSDGKSFMIDGKRLKSINQWYNKENARLSSIKDLQSVKGCTKRQYLLTRKRNRRIQNYMYCAAKKIVQFCLDNQIGNIVVGYNDGFQQNPNLGRVNNQKFTMIPFGKLKSRIEYLCSQYGICFTQQEESYTSKASFFDNDIMPKWNPQNSIDAKFSGKRIHRGLYQTSTGYTLNADVNGALNILRKSNLTDLTVLQSSGVVNTPLRIHI